MPKSEGRVRRFLSDDHKEKPELADLSGFICTSLFPPPGKEIVIQEKGLN